VKPDLTTLAKVLAGGLPGGCVAGRADLLDFLEVRPGKPKMKHPGTFNANPLSAAAGCAALAQVATGDPSHRANEIGRLLRRRLNEVFVGRGDDWVCYGEFSAFKLLPGYDGPRPESDDSAPYGGEFERLEVPRDRRLVHAFRLGMLLHGVDLMGLGGMTTAAHTEEDVERTAAAVAGTLDLMRTMSP
jgi:glutamate-1-semialdehyde 2,1-aminomutase